MFETEATSDIYSCFARRGTDNHLASQSPQVPCKYRVKPRIEISTCPPSNPSLHSLHLFDSFPETSCIFHVRVVVAAAAMMLVVSNFLFPNFSVSRMRSSLVLQHGSANTRQDNPAASRRHQHESRDPKPGVICTTFHQPSPPCSIFAVVQSTVASAFDRRHPPTAHPSFQTGAEDTVRHGTLTGTAVTLIIRAGKAPCYRPSPAFRE